MCLAPWAAVPICWQAGRAGRFTVAFLLRSISLRQGEIVPFPGRLSTKEHRFC